MQSILQDLRFGLRLCVQRPGFTLVAILSLALGIGATTAIFSVINGVLLRPLTFPQADRILKIDERHSEFASGGNFTYANFNDLNAALGAGEGALSALAAARPWSFNLTEGSEPEQVTGAQVSQHFLDVLRVAPLLGRSFNASEDQPNGEPVILLSYGLWQRRFGGDPDIVGKTIRVSDISRTVIGVLPQGFSYPRASQVWTPLTARGALQDNRRAHLLTVIGRLRDGATPEQAEAEVAAVAGRISEQYAGIDPDLTFQAASLQQRLVAPIRPALLILLIAVGLLLLIACANVANLLLSRAATREKEMAIRAALGSGRWRLARQTLTESLLLAIISGAVGLLLALWSLDAIKSLNISGNSPLNIPRLQEVSLDGRVFVFTLLISVLTGILFGLAPALRLSQVRLTDALKEGGRTSAESGGKGSNRLRRALVVAEVALSLILLVGAGLLINSFVRLSQVQPGFEPNNLLTMFLFLSPTKYSEGAQQSQTIARILENVRAVPGVRSASVVNVLPIQNAVATTFEVENRRAPQGEERLANIQVIDPDYFQTMSIRLLKGRAFTRQDAAGTPQVMLINEAMVAQMFSDEDPLGKRITMRDWGPPLTGEIVGIVSDVKADGLEQDVRPMIYWNHPQFPQIFNNLVIRTEGDPLSVVAEVKSQIWAVDREQTISTIRTMNDWLADSVVQRRFNMLLLAVFAGIALVLASVGLYGVMSYAVAQRTPEIGVRLALGATPRAVMQLVISDGMKMAGLGLLIGLGGALIVTRFMEGLLFGIQPTDWLTFTAVFLLLAGVALIACFVPARRAAKVDPLVALRYE